MAKITGRVEVVVNGEPLLNKEGAIIRGIGVDGRPAFEREPVMGDTGIHGFIEKTVAAECECTITDRDDISLSALCDILENGTVIFRGANGGKSYTMDGATCTSNLEITAGEGETAIKFVGKKWVEAVQ